MLSKLAPRDKLVLSLFILLACAVALYCVFTFDERDVIEIEFNNEKSRTLSFDDFSLTPGEECEYTFTFDGEEIAPYDVVLQFNKTHTTGSENYIYVRITVDGKVFKDAPLANLFEESPVLICVDPAANKTDDIKVVYYMPSDVGNEAQNAGVAFDLVITATNEQSIEEVVQ